MNTQKINYDQSMKDSESFIPKEIDLINQIKINNQSYVLNIIVRTVGTILAADLLGKLTRSFSVDFRYKIFNYLTTFKALAQLAGVMMSYIITSEKRDTNWVLKKWLNSSSISYLWMSLLLWGFKRYPKWEKILLWSFLLNQVWYYYQKGIMNGGRPIHYARLGKNFKAGEGGISDIQKKLLGERKLSTSIADTFGSIILALFNYWSISIPNIYLGLIAMSINLYASKFLADKIEGTLQDPDLTEKDQIDFKGNIKDWANDLPSNVIDGFRVLRAGNNGSYGWKISAFIVYFSLKKLGVLDKSLILFKSSVYPDFRSSFAWQSKVLLNIINTLWDLIKVWYRNEYGKHIMSSLGALSASSVLMTLSRMILMFCEMTNRAWPAVWVSYPLSGFASNMLISSLMHLFEVWGISNKSESSLFKSFRLNMISLLLDFFSKPFNLTLNYFNIEYIVQGLILIFSVILESQIFASSEGAETI